MHHNTKNAESLFWLEYEQNQTIILWLESPKYWFKSVLCEFMNGTNILKELKSYLEK